MISIVKIGGDVPNSSITDYSITCPASFRTDSGIVIPSSCANFLLITDLPVEKTLTGVSAGFAPFKTCAIIYQLPHQGRVGQLQRMPNHPASTMAVALG